MESLRPFERYRPLLDDWPAFTEALARPLPVCIWTNTLKTTAGRLAQWLDEEGWPAEGLPWYPGAFKLPAAAAAGSRLPYLAGLYHIQEEVSLLPPWLLDPRPGERILDLCAAPGNKTAQMAVLMRNWGTVVANDRHAGRLHVVRATLGRLGLLNVSTTCHDAASYPTDAPGYDRVLADVPCTCEGTSRKHPGVVRQLGAHRSGHMSRLQQAILRKAVALCKAGGRIVYATCTYAPEENELVVDAVLREQGDALRVLPARVEGFAASEGITSWNGQLLHASLKHTLRVWPHQNDTGGFFVAILEKHVP